MHTISVLTDEWAGTSDYFRGAFDGIPFGGFLAYSEVFQGRVEVVQLQGGSVIGSGVYQDLGGLLIAGDSQSWALLLPGCALQAFPRLFRFDRFCPAVR
jgi:hypothetical protein